MAIAKIRTAAKNRQKKIVPQKTGQIPVSLKHLEAMDRKQGSQITSVMLKCVSNQESLQFLNKRVDSLKSEISSKFAKVDLRFKKLEAKIDEKFLAIDKRFENLEKRFEARFESVEKRLDQLESRIESVLHKQDQFAILILNRFTEADAKFESMMSTLHKWTAVIEEQNSRNKFVLDGYAQIFAEGVSTKKRVAKLEKSVLGKEQF